MNARSGAHAHKINKRATTPVTSEIDQRSAVWGMRRLIRHLRSPPPPSSGPTSAIVHLAQATADGRRIRDSGNSPGVVLERTWIRTTWCLLHEVILYFVLCGLVRKQFKCPAETGGELFNMCRD